jgi:hypothetical protein
MRRSYVVPMRWVVIYEYEVPGGALNLNSSKLPRPWSPWGSSSSRKNPHGRAWNRTRDLMISSQKLWPLDQEAGRVSSCWLFGLITRKFADNADSNVSRNVRGLTICHVVHFLQNCEAKVQKNVHPTFRRYLNQCCSFCYRSKLGKEQDAWLVWCDKAAKMWQQVAKHVTFRLNLVMHHHRIT